MKILPLLCLLLTSCSVLWESPPEVDRQAYRNLNTSVRFHPKNLKGKEDFWYKRFHLYMTPQEKKQYLATPPQQRWQKYKKILTLFQELEDLRLACSKPLSNKDLQIYRLFRSTQKAYSFLKKNGYLSNSP